MGKPRNDLIDRLQYVGLRLASMVLHAFPVSMNLRTAKALGSFMYWVDRRHRERALGNLQRSFPEMSPAMRRRMAEGSVQQLAMFFIEMLFTTRLIHIDTWAKYVELQNFEEVMRRLLDRRQGLIMLTGHYGNWEVLGYVLATLGFPTTSIARRWITRM